MAKTKTSGREKIEKIITRLLQKEIVQILQIEYLSSLLTKLVRRIFDCLYLLPLITLISYSSDEWIATQRRCYEILKLVSK